MTIAQQTDASVPDERIDPPDETTAATPARVPKGTESSTRSATMMIAVVLSGLFAGFFLTYCASVQLGLARVDDMTYVRTFQAINETIRNPAFAVFFFGCVPAIVLALFAHRHEERRTVVALAIGCVMCATVVAITFAGSVPLNDELATYVDPTLADAHIARAEFETTWNRLNLVRTVCSIAGATAVAWAATRRAHATPPRSASSRTARAA